MNMQEDMSCTMGLFFLQNVLEIFKNEVKVLTHLYWPFMVIAEHSRVYNL